MNFLQISLNEAITKAVIGEQVFMLMPVHPGTTTEELNTALGYVAPKQQKKPGPKPKSGKKAGRKSKIDDEKIRSLYEDGVKPAEIAKQMGVTNTTVVDHLKKMGIYESQLPIDDGKVKALFEGGWQLSEIADEMRVSVQTIKQRLEGMGFKE